MSFSTCGSKSSPGTPFFKGSKPRKVCRNELAPAEDPTSVPRALDFLRMPLSHCKVSAKFVCAGFERGPALVAWNKPCLVCGSGVSDPPPRPATHAPPLPQRFLR